MRVAGARARVKGSRSQPTSAAAKAVIAVTSSCRPRSTPDWRVDLLRVRVRVKGRGRGKGRGEGAQAAGEGGPG